MVGEAAHKGAAGEGAERSSLILAALVGHEGLGEHASVVFLLHDGLNLEGSLGRMSKGLIHHHNVKDVALSPVVQGAVAIFDHAQERVEEFIVPFHILDVLLVGMQELGHGDVRGVVVHIAHHHNLDARELLLELHGAVVGNLGAARTEVCALSAQTGRKVAHEEGEHFPINGTADHQDVTGAEGILFLLGPLAPVYAGIVVKGERNGLGGNVVEDFRPVEQRAVHAAAVRAVVVHNLVVGIRDGGLVHQVVQHVAVLYFGHAQHGMPCTVVFLHFCNDLGHVLEFLGILGLRPGVAAVREVLVVIMTLVMVGIEQVLKVVKTYHIGLSAFLRPQGRTCQQEQGRKYVQELFHTS